MTELLRLRVPLRPGQSLLSFVAHLARRNGINRLDQFCCDVDLKPLALATGQPQQIDRLATLSGVPAAALQAEAVFISKNGCAVRGQKLMRADIESSGQSICPACLHEDYITAESAFSRSAYMRTIWRVTAIRTCLRHSMAVGPFLGQDRRLRYEPALFLEVTATRLNEALRSAVQREVSPLERYLLRRLDGVGGAAPFLDRLDFYVAARFCEVLGVAASEGPRVSPSEVGEDRLRASGTLGFEVASAGEDAISTLLVEMQSKSALLHAMNAGPGAAFGALYRLLAANKTKPEYSGLREFLKRHVEATVPLVPGRKFLSMPLQEGVVHSVRTASLVTGAHPKRLRKILAGLGHVESGREGGTDHDVTFDAAGARALLESLAEAMSMKEAAAYLNINRMAFSAIVRSGRLQPVLCAGEIEGIGRSVFTRSQLDRFLANLEARAIPIKKTGEDVANIGEAARHCCCTVADVVGLILEGKVLWVGRSEGARGFQAILVRIKDLRQLVCGEAAHGLTLRQFGREIGKSDAAVKVIIGAGAVKTIEAKNPVRRNLQIYITRDEISSFRSNYVSSASLSPHSSLNNKVIKFFSEKGVTPRIRIPNRFDCFYKKSDVEEYLGELEHYLSNPA
ncbi:hypothetical protein J2X36_005271 [Methylobacterium sp. BE186]|uniref:TniQ family protein n=1 Tax=Methylobacterium sp. BE186 TaxID=2817715 RepID=UPI00285E244B|nr:TniQ family protein [Methylobacterium sp. BE186]MDR7040488.1 hypothetical protein [Methylobacterium sp. BE186]